MKKNAKKNATWALTSADLQKQAEKFGVNPKGYSTFASFMEALKVARAATKDSNLAILAATLKAQTKSERAKTEETVLATAATQVAEAEELRKAARKSKDEADAEIKLCDSKLKYWNSRKARAKEVKKTSNQTIRSANLTKSLAREFRKEFKTIAKSIDALATV